MENERITRDPAGVRLGAVSWGGPFAAGVLLVAIGLFSIVASPIAGLASVVMFGLLLLVAALGELVAAVRARGTKQFLPHLLEGILAFVVAGVFLLRPVAGLAALTLLLAGYFFADGLFRAVTSVVERYAAWSWDLITGLVSLTLGVIIMARWPVSALWLVGVTIGVHVVSRGLQIMGAALALRRYGATGGLRTAR